MKAGFVLTLVLFTLGNSLVAQKNCSSYTYQQQAIQKDPSLLQKINAIERFAAQPRVQQDDMVGTESGTIKVPVVVHILYHYPWEKITDEQINQQINILNECFRRRNTDAANTPAVFKPLAADCEIEFQLAISDPRRRSTNGIVRKYTPLTYWEMDDKMKFSSEMGSDAWDSKSYLNVWVCNLDMFAGYSSVMGGPANLDGVVIGFSAFGTNTGFSMPGTDLGKTLVHEVGHWLNLRHIWGDAQCGDDLVGDTPKQETFHMECPTGVMRSCGNTTHGDMYMNYMDLTSDACMNLFTLGQKARMRGTFDPGGARHSILASKGLQPPLIFESPLPDDEPQWLHPRLFPNPAVSEMTLDLSYDPRWLGKTLWISNAQGQLVMNVTITSKLQRIQVTGLKPGVYFLAAKKEDGESIKQKFVKL